MSEQGSCIFCQIVAGDAPSWRVYETEHTLAFFPIHPANEYHTLVIPKRHYVNIFDTPADELTHVMATIKHIVDLYQSKLGIDNVQIINSSGSDAQQDVFHLHFHIVPRHRGDGNDVRWHVDSGMLSRFDEMLQQLH